MLKPKPRRVFARSLPGALVTTGVLLSTGVVLPMAVAPLLADGAHPVPPMTYVQPGARFTPLPILAPCDTPDAVITQLTYRHCGEQHRPTLLPSRR
jgi:hypothetical protein